MQRTSFTYFDVEKLQYIWKYQLPHKLVIQEDILTVATLSRTPGFESQSAFIIFLDEAPVENWQMEAFILYRVKESEGKSNKHT